MGPNFNGLLNYDEVYLGETYDGELILRADGLRLASGSAAFVPWSKLLSETSRQILCLNPYEGQVMWEDLRFVYLPFHSLL